MKWHKYKNRLKEEMNAHQSEVDVDALWSSLEPQVETINKGMGNTNWYWFLGIGTLFIASSFMFFSYISQDDEKQKQPTAHALSAIQSPATSSIPVAEHDNYQEKPSLQKLAPSQNTTSKIDTLTNAGLAPEASGRTERKLQETKNTTSVKKQTKEYTPASSTQTPKSSTSEDDSNRPPIAMEVPGSKTNKQNNSLKNTSDKEVTDPTLTKHAAPKNSEVPKTKTPESQRSIMFKSFAELPRTTTPLLKTKKENISTDHLKASEQEEDYIKTKGLFYSATFQAGIASTGRKLESPGDTTSERVLQNRLNSETPLENLQFSILGGVHHHTGFNVMSGVQYTRITERFEVLNTSTVVDSVFGVVRILVNPNGDTTFIRGNIPVETTTTSRKRYYNRYSLIDIPLLVGYQKQFDNFHLGLQAGVFANLSLTTEGRILDQDSQLIDIEKSQDLIFKKNIGISYYASFSVGYELNSGVVLSLAPYIHHYPNRITVDEYPLAQKYSLLGVKAGISYRF